MQNNILCFQLMNEKINRFQVMGSDVKVSTATHIVDIIMRGERVEPEQIQKRAEKILKYLFYEGFIKAELFNVKITYHPDKP